LRKQKSMHSKEVFFCAKGLSVPHGLKITVAHQYF